MIKYMTLCLSLMLSLNVVAQEGIVFSTHIDKDTLRIGETFKIEFILDGASFNDIHLPDFEGFEIVSGPYQSLQTQVINGKISQQASYGFRLRPTRAGELTIKPATAQFDNTTIEIDPVKLYVLNEKVDPDYTPSERRDLFDYSFPPTPTPPTPPKKKKRKTIKI